MDVKKGMKSKKLLCGLLVLFLILALVPQPAMAAEYAVADGQTLDLSTGQLTWTDGGALIDTYTISGGDVINVAPGANATIKGGANVMIACGAGTALTIEGVTIDLSAVTDACAISFTGAGNRLILSGTSSVISGEEAPGVRAEEGCALEISGGGTLNVTGGLHGAGIGGGTGQSGGMITISGGTIHATGGDGVSVNGECAGIGGGKNGKCGTFAMTGGTVYAKGAYRGAGIGSGSGPNEGMDFGVINISGGTVVAEALGNGGAGIGGGFRGSGTINITGGTISAKSNSYGAGIGSGEYADNGEINISGGKITAISLDNGAAIGGGDEGSAGRITIQGDAEITATGADDGPGIGSGKDAATGGTVNISGDVKITATGGEWAAGIGGGYGSVCPVVTIAGGTVNAVGGADGAAGIGGGKYGNGGAVNISGGTVYAIKSDTGTYDIGNGLDGSDGTISITGESSLLLGTDSINPQPTAPEHTHYAFSEMATDVYGIPVPEGWMPPFGAYLIVCDINYNANGGSGSAPLPEEKAVGVVVQAEENPFTYEEHEFTGWNTKADGSGEDYAPGETFTVTGDITLFAQWYAPVQSVTLDKHNLTMYTGATYQLTATLIPEGSGVDINWTSNNEDIATVEGGLVKAVKAGGASITAEAEGKTDICTVIVSGPGPGPTPTPKPAPKPATSPTEEIWIEKTEVIIEKEVEGVPFINPMQGESEDEQGRGMVTLTIQTAGLPGGTTAVLLADGRIIELTGEDEIDIEIDAIYVPEGNMQLIPLDKNNRPLGIFTVDGQAIQLNETEGEKAESAWKDIAVWLIITLAGVGVALYLVFRTLYMILKRMRRK